MTFSSETLSAIPITACHRDRPVSLPVDRVGAGWSCSRRRTIGCRRRICLTFELLMACHRSQSSWSPSQKSARIPKTRSRRSAVSGDTARRPRTISFKRGNDTPSLTAKSDCVTPRGFRNSSRSISPGCVGGRCVGSLMSAVRGLGLSALVVVRDFDVVGIVTLPSETHSILVVDPNAVQMTSCAS